MYTVTKDIACLELTSSVNTPGLMTAIGSFKVTDFGTDRKPVRDLPLVNKSVQSNLGRGPRRCNVAHVRRKVPIGYNGAPQIRPKSTPSRGRIPKPHYLPHPWTLPTYDAKRHRDPIRRFFHNALDRPTDRQTNRQIVHGKVWRV